MESISLKRPAWQLELWVCVNVFSGCVKLHDFSVYIYTISVSVKYSKTLIFFLKEKNLQKITGNIGSLFEKKLTKKNV